MDLDFVDLDLQVLQGNQPDLTRRIMGRLGYMQVRGGAARRHRIIRWGNRAAITLVAGFALMIGMKMVQSSPDARRPVEVTIPAAISSDVQQHRIRMGNFIRTISNFGPPQRNPMGTDGFGEEFAEPQTLERDFEQPVAAPFRWV